MKIAVLVHSLDGIGGIVKHLLLQCRELVEMGHEIDIWAVEYDPERCYPDLMRGFTVHALRKPQPVSTQIYQVAPGLRMLVYLRELWRTYWEQRRLVAAMPAGYDVVNPHGAGVTWAAAAYQRRHGTPSVWMCYDFWPMARGTAEGEGGLKGLLKQAVVAPLDRYDRYATRAMDRIAVLSDGVQAQMRDYYGVETVVLRTGIDTAHYAQGDDPAAGRALRQRHGVADDTFLLLTVAMLMPRRRIEDVLAAVRGLVDEERDLRYLLVGRITHSPDYTAFVQHEIARLGLQDVVKLAGEVSEADLVAAYQACDAFIWPADEGQSWGMAALEAMAAGKPVLVSRANGLAEVLEDGRTAMLFDARAPETVAAALRHLLGDPALRQQIAASGQQFVHDTFSWRRNAETMLSLFTAAGARTGQ
ncbi:MAG: glycosyltransferase family 4 protein [Anaerolineae bacterium]|nr:glycosyltransferase family 4 protein [Anaerolineae bacterium]